MNTEVIGNKDYTHFVVDADNNIVCSGWEYKSDAVDSMRDLLECDDIKYKVYTRKFINVLIKKGLL